MKVMVVSLHGAGSRLLWEGPDSESEVTVPLWAASGLPALLLPQWRQYGPAGGMLRLAACSHTTRNACSHGASSASEPQLCVLDLMLVHLEG